ncbi:alpha/beta hydrolase [Nocardioides sp. NPDC059952]|uniref:alpha/beta hydrolase n=1 Tax=Nocardioides sp. NPDC059952 TaxID=3347014 RepID=UPI003658D8D3
MTITILLPPTPGEVPDFKADAAKVEAEGNKLRTASSIFDDHGSFVAHGAKDSGLRDGVSSVAYMEGLGPIGEHADACSLALREAAVALMTHGDDLVSLKQRHGDLAADRAQLVRDIDRVTARTSPMPTDEAELRELQLECERCTNRVQTYEHDKGRWAEDLTASEEKAAAVLRRLMTEDQVNSKYAGAADPADAAKASMPPDKDPKAIKSWWDGLTEEQREAMTAAYPEIVGNTDGIPAAARHEANTISLDRDLVEFGQIPAGVRTDEEQAAFENAVAADDARKYINGTIDPASNEPYVAQIYAYDPAAFDGDGAVAMAVGDLDTAKNVSTITPGLTNDGGSAPNLAEDAVNVQQATSFEGGNSNASMFWMGYDAPDDGDSPGVSREDMAKEGGRRLADTFNGLNAMRDDDFHLTAIGHSYGSTTLSHAMTDHSPDVDDVVLAGSPGAGDNASTAGDFGVGDGHVWVGANSEDPVADLGDQGRVSPGPILGGGLAGPLGGLLPTGDIGMGRNPAEDDFGAIRFQAESTTRGETGIIGDHTKYFDQGTESLSNIAHIVNGQYGEVARADHVHDPWWRTPTDPEADRTPTTPDTEKHPQ